jgi:hypothetical protein
MRIKDDSNGIAIEVGQVNEYSELPLEVSFDFGQRKELLILTPKEIESLIAHLQKQCYGN